MFIRSFLQSMDQHRRKKDYKHCLLNNKEFSTLQDILKKNQKCLKSIRKGNKPNRVNPLTGEKIDEFYCKGVLGKNTPRALLNTVWMNNCIFFAMRPGKEHPDLCQGDLQLKTNSEGVRYGEFSKDRQTKTHTGETPRNDREVNLKMFESPDNPERCPVLTYLANKE